MNEREIFIAALQVDDDKREAYLDEACGGDLELRERVEALMTSLNQAGSFLQQSPVESAPTLDQPISERPGTEIGPYKLLQQIGEGGMGVVYMAEQSEPVERRVALKIIKPGMDTRQVIARFEAERQALAMMDHPNIAKVLDAGTTDSGRPYFVMELVKGIPVTKYCDEQHLSPKERLELFIPICQAVQHAHQKGIIHRDIKPSNILVALYDGQPVPKVIDFGVAKATSQKLTEKTMFTQYGQIVGTLEYMSPEQANLNQLDIDTRSDIYSLGVLLYELLTGATPFDKERLRSAAFEEMMRIIREEEPPRPSLRLSTIDTLPSVAANRKIEPKKLSVLVRGELDWIVMKALEKDRARRYETATGFANDIQRYLNDEAVVACPPSAGYRFRKFARRNKVALFTVAIVAASLILGVFGTSWQAVQAARAERSAVAERDRAQKAEKLAGDRYQNELVARRQVQQQRDRAEAAEKDAKTEAAIAKAVNEFLTSDLLAQADPDNEPDRDIKLRTVVDRAAEKVEGRFVDQPLVEAAIRRTLGITYSSLGEYGKAQQHHERGLELLERELGPEHPATLSTRMLLALEKTAQGRFEEAEILLRELVEIQRRVLGPEHPDTLRSMGNLANALREEGRYEEGEKLHREVLEILQNVLGPEDLGTVNNRMGLALAIHYQGRHKEAEKLLREALEIFQRVAGPEHPDTLESMHNLACAISDQGRDAEAEKLYREALEIRRRVLSPEHPDTLTTISSLAALISNSRRYGEAEKLFREVVEIQRRVLPEHPNTLTNMNNLAVTIWDQGRYEEAEKLTGEVLEIRSRLLGPEHAETLQSMNTLALALTAQGRNEDAEKLYREALKIWEKLARDSPNVPAYRVSVGGGYCNLASVLAQAGRSEEALPFFARAQEALEGVLRQSPQDAAATGFLRNVHSCRARTLEQLSRHDEAAQDWEQATQLSSDTDQRARVRWSISLARSGEYDRATTEANLVAQSPNVTGTDIYNCACVFALASGAETDDATLREHYVSRALELLQDARNRGFQFVKLFHGDPDLEALRQRPEFQQFIEELDVSSANRATDS